MASTFTPSKAIPFDGKLLQELQGGVSDDIARSILKECSLQLTSSSVIHDNGCGYGAVTIAIMESNPPEGIQIHSTDLNPAFVGQLDAKLTENPSWPVKTDVQDASELAFPDNTFTHSITNFVFACSDGDVAKVKHIMRTLRSGGTAVISQWADMPWHTALEQAHYKTRGEKQQLPPFLSHRGYNRDKMMDVTSKAGWQDLRIVQKTAWLDLGTDLTRWATLAWSYLATPAGGWTQRDEDKWDEAVGIIVEELSKGRGDSYKVEGGVHRIRMVADVGIAVKA